MAFELEEVQKSRGNILNSNYDVAGAGPIKAPSSKWLTLATE